MIFPADTAAWLVDLTGATGQAKGMMILAGISLWYSVAIGAMVSIGAAVVAAVDFWRR